MHSVSPSPGALTTLAFESENPEPAARLEYIESALGLIAGGQQDQIEDRPILMRSLYGQVLMQKALAHEQLGIVGTDAVDVTIHASLDSLQCRDPDTQRARAVALTTALRIRNMRLARGIITEDDQHITGAWGKEAERILQEQRDTTGKWDPVASTLDLERAIGELYQNNKSGVLKLAVRGIRRAYSAMDQHMSEADRATYIRSATKAHCTVIRAAGQRPAKRDESILDVLQGPHTYTHIKAILQANMQLPRRPLAA